MKKEALQLFEQRKVRTVWDDDEEKWYFSIVDVCGVLTDSKDALTARKYWNKLKQRLKEEVNETVTNCHQLKLLAGVYFHQKRQATTCYQRKWKRLRIRNNNGK